MGFDFSQFELTPELRRQLGHQLIERINDYFSSLSNRAVQLPASERTFGELSDQMPELGEDAAAVLDDACRELIDKGFHIPSANYFGLMNPTPTYMAVLAEALVAALNPQLATLARSQLASKIEHETVRWLGERVGWPGHFDGTFTSGGNEANFSALALALAAHFPQLPEEGLAAVGAQPVFYASAESHHSLDKSAGLLGLGRKALRRIPVDRNLQMDPQLLEEAVRADLAAAKKPFCVVATAGTTNSGAIDNLEAVAEICRRHQLWMHVDGAYGAALIFSDQHRGMLRGIEHCDSLTIDPHKWLAMPFAAGVVLTKHSPMLQRAFGISTPYMPKIAGAPLVDNYKVSAQWSRRMNSLKLWLTLRVHGRLAYEHLIARQLEMAKQLAAWFAQSEHFELAAPPRLPILNVRVKIDGDEAQVAAANAAMVDEVTRDGEQWISLTHARGRSVIRMMIISYLTTEANVRQLQQTLTAAAEKVLAREHAARA